MQNSALTRVTRSLRGQLASSVVVLLHTSIGITAASASALVALSGQFAKASGLLVDEIEQFLNRMAA